MKVRVTFKDPDNDISNIITGSMLQELLDKGRITEQQADRMSEDEINEIFKKEFSLTFDNIYEKVGRFVEYGEYVAIEVDVDTDTASVLPVEKE